MQKPKGFKVLLVGWSKTNLKPTWEHNVKVVAIVEFNMFPLCKIWFQLTSLFDSHVYTSVKHHGDFDQVIVVAMWVEGGTTKTHFNS